MDADIALIGGTGFYRFLEDCEEVAVDTPYGPPSAEIGFNTVGSLQPEIRRGDFVFCDQYVDRTSGREVTAYSGRDGVHIAAAEPYCPTLRPALYEAVQG